MKISPIKLGVGGRAKLEADADSHQMVVRGAINFKPRFRARVRVNVRSYERLARQNKAEEINPWAIININAPFSPQVVCEKILAVTRLMWPTEEYAISAFMSHCRKQITLVMRAPQIQKVIKNSVFGGERGKSAEIRIRPYPPSFRRMAAKIIDPAIGASTCALGSQR